MNRLWVRLTIGFLLTFLLLLLLVTLVVNYSVTSSFRQYVYEMDVTNFGRTSFDSLTDYYRAHRTWVGADSLLPVAGNGQGGRSGRGLQSFVAGNAGVIVVATNPDWVGLPVNEIGASRTTPLTVDGQAVGVVGQQSPGGQRMADAEHRFAEQINTALIGIGLLAGMVALTVGILLSYNLVRPLQRLAERIRPLTSSQLGQQVPVEGPTEVRELAGEFNALSHRLAASEQQRQQMSTDVAHELRTPVTVLRGHLEAMMDGVYPLDVEHLAVAYDQTIHLARLVEDLRLLTQAEAGRLALNPTSVAVDSMISAAVARFGPLAQDAGIGVKPRVDANLPPVRVDANRMQQVFDNLLANALRHTPANGEISIAARRNGLFVEIAVTNPGQLASSEVEHLFDRFWRADDAHQRDAGGSGLGLAITRQLILLQHGEIRAQVQDGTISFLLNLPAVA